MNTARNNHQNGRGAGAEDYMPKERPEIVNIAERLHMKDTERHVAQINDYCVIAERPQINLVGIGVPVSFESQGYPDGPQFNDYTFNDYFIAKKYIGDGTLAFLAQVLGADIKSSEIISARYAVHGDGNYQVIVGIRLDSLDQLPEFLPEHTVTLTIPPARYAKLMINEQKREGRVGYEERMHADEYFIGAFRKDTGYVYDVSGYPMNTWDDTGDVLTKYEPVRLSANESDGLDTFSLSPVLLPPMKVACCVQHAGAGNGDSVIGKYFKVQDAVYKTGLARYYKSDYYGFPIDVEGGYASCFGSRVISFDGLPDCVERITLPGGMYVHVTQAEFNGDNPSMSYHVAFNHMDRLYFRDHPELEFDNTRKVIARFRQANCSSVFVPVRRKA